MANDRHGFTVIELLVALTFFSIMMAGVAGVFATQSKGYSKQSNVAGLEMNVRMGMDMVLDTLRDAGYGVPDANLVHWITWVPGFVSNPRILPGAGVPDRFSVATATAQPVTTLAAGAAAGDTTIDVTSTAGIAPGAMGLLLIDDSENATIVGIAATTVSIDTNPMAAGDQGLARAYPADTPVYRVDVVTFSTGTGGGGVPQLMRDLNQGAGPQPAVQTISDMRVTTITAGERYLVTLTGEKLDVASGQTLQEELTSDVTLVN